ncbi:serine/threonine protein kinase [Halobacteriovorax sp. DPLXC-1]|uniref:serine/threonine protein kinase n=1 Tax=Halobacteriovorax sp. DPLXC-1 TaxID=3110771 RepID=UPI002FF060CF
MSEEKKFERFGRYLILDHLVDGGMAKICRARFLGEQADKIVAIKMVQPQFSSDEAFQQMFMDEIKTTFGLLHPNIVQTYDYGFHNNQLFVAMEYCDGRNLKQYIDKLKEHNYVFPVEISVFITIQAAQGLHYAHTFTDKLTGKPANIIHRDISPHNIMLTFDGSVKVIDFGIAKSETNSEATQAGTIKGKLSYLAPEYLDGLDLDPRYDLFATAITLWEMLCSRKLFKASNDLAVLKKIQECKIPVPSSINPMVPKELDKIILKALHKDRSKRYQSLEEFARALNKFLYSTYPDFNSSDLSYFAKELFKDEIKTDRERMFEFGQIDLGPYIKDYKAESEGGAPSQSSGPQNNSAKKRKQKEALFELDIDEQTDIQVEGSMPKLDLASKTSKTKINTIDIKSNKTSAGTKIKRIKKKKKPVKKKKSYFIHVASIAALAVGVYFAKDQIPFLGDKPVENTKQAEVAKEGSKREPTSSVKSTLTLKNFNRNKDKLYINGEQKEVDVLNRIKLSTNELMTIRVEKSGREHFIIHDISLQEGESRSIKVESMPIAYYGYLQTSSACLVGKVSFELFGEQREEKLPIRFVPGIPLATGIDAQGDSVPKEYEVTVESAKSSVPYRVKFEISNSKVVDLCKLL